MKKIVLFSIPVVLLTLVVGGVYFVKNRHLPNRIQSFVPGLADSSPIPAFALDPSKQFLSLEDRFKSLNLDNSKIILTVDNSTKDVVSWSLDGQGNKTSGFNFSLSPSLINIHIYLGENVLKLNRDQILLQVNRNYVTAIYAVSESFETSKNYRDSSVKAFEEFKILSSVPSSMPIQYAK